MNEAHVDPLVQNYLRRAVEISLSADDESLLEEMAIDRLDYSRGRLRAVIRFPGGRRLSVRMRIDVIRNSAIPRRYSMHFMDSDNATIFRYDNSPHFHEGEIDHKHEGGAVFACPRPSVRQIRNEIIDHLSANANRETSP